MLLELLMAVPLEGETQRLPPKSWLDGLQNLLLLGHWQDAVELPKASPAGVLARLYHTLRQLDPAGQVRLREEPTLLLERKDAEPAPLDLDDLPLSWQQGLTDGTFSFVGLASDLRLTLTASFSTRTSRGRPALRLSLRAVAAGLLPPHGLLPTEPLVDQEPPPAATNLFVLPEEAPPPLAVPLGYPQKAYVEALRQLLSSSTRLRDLRTHLLTQGQQLATTLELGLGTLAARKPETLARVLVLRELQGLEGLLQGLPPEAHLHLETVGRIFEQLRPPLAPVYRRRPDGRLECWHGDWQAAEPAPEGL